MEYKTIESDKPGVPLYAMKAAHTDPETVYYHRTKKEHDIKRFKSAMVKAVTSQIGEGTYSVTAGSEVPEGVTVHSVIRMFKALEECSARRDCIEHYREGVYRIVTCPMRRHSMMNILKEVNDKGATSCTINGGNTQQCIRRQQQRGQECINEQMPSTNKVFEWQTAVSQGIH